MLVKVTLICWASLEKGQKSTLTVYFQFFNPTQNQMGKQAMAIVSNN